jgi:putative transposase
VREQFLVELDEATCAGIASLAEMNRLLAAWIDTVYHRAPHAETGMAPLARWRQGITDPLPLPSAAQLREAFLWHERRRVTKTATVSLHGNTYQVDPILARRYVELVFDPFDLTDIDVRHDKRPAGKATVFTIGRHAHPKARPESNETGPGDVPTGPPEPTGIDYLRALDNARGRHLAQQINYAALYDHDQPEPDESGEQP